MTRLHHTALFWALTLAVLLGSVASAHAQTPGALPAAVDDGDLDAHVFFFRGQLFGGFDALFTETDDFNQFVLRRAELGAGYAYEWAGLFINAEAIRSASPESLIGIQGNSIVARFKHAFGYADPELGPGRLTARFGLIPDLWIRTLEATYTLRAMAPLASERGHFFDTSDLGGSVGYALWDGLVELSAGFTNGEGAANPEENTGKNLSLVLSVRPLMVDFLGGTGVLGVHGGYRDGSLSVASLRNHRIMGALTWHHPRFSAGVEYVHALGWLGRGSLEAYGLGGWAEGHILPQWLGVAARFDRFDTDTSGDDDHVQLITAGLYTDLLDPALSGRLRVHIDYENRSVGNAAGPVPGVPNAVSAHLLMITVEGSAAIGF